MSTINVVRTLGDELALVVQRVDEAGSALRSLRADAAASDEIMHAVSSGATWDDPFDAVREYAQQGNRGIWDAWTGSTAAASVLDRAIQRHPGGAGLRELQRAREAAQDASAQLDEWIASGARASIEGLDALVQPRLAEVRDLVGAVRSAGA